MNHSPRSELSNGQVPENGRRCFQLGSAENLFAKCRQKRVNKGFCSLTTDFIIVRFTWYVFPAVSILFSLREESFVFASSRGFGILPVCTGS